MDELIRMVVGVVGSIGISAAIFISLNKVADLLPIGARNAVRPWIFVGPALIFIFAALVVPTMRTLYLSFFDNSGDNYVGGENYGWIFTNDSIFGFDGIGGVFTSRLFILGIVIAGAAGALTFRSGRRNGSRVDLSGSTPLVLLGAAATFLLFAVFTNLSGVIWNNLWWVVAVTGIATSLGLAVAVLADQVKGESIAKSLIFLPMAISFVGASIIWRFVYSFSPAGRDQIGILNGVWVGLGGQPLAVLQDQPWNTFFLIVVLIWAQTGFAMVVLSSAIKAVPDEFIEAARVDGATKQQIFWKIILPQISSTIVVVVTTLIILVMKVFDIVKVMTNGEFGTNVIANEMFDQSFRFQSFGRGSALAVVLFISVLPIMIMNVRRVRNEQDL